MIDTDGEFFDDMPYTERPMDDYEALILCQDMMQRSSDARKEVMLSLMNRELVWLREFIGRLSDNELVKELSTAHGLERVIHMAQLELNTWKRYMKESYVSGRWKVHAPTILAGMEAAILRDKCALEEIVRSE